MLGKQINQLRQKILFFFNNNVKKKDNLKGYNSFVAPHNYYEYQADLFFVNDDEFLENQNFKVGMIMIDIFSKYMWVVPIKSKSEGDVAAGLLECFIKWTRNQKYYIQMMRVH